MPVQNYITAIVVFLIVEQLMTWGFYGKSQVTSILCPFAADRFQSSKTKMV